MSEKGHDDRWRRIHRVEEEQLAEQILAAARELAPDSAVDRLELRHLVRVITECSLLLTDVYSEERIARIMHPDRGFFYQLVDRLIEQQRRGEGEAYFRIRRLPDDVRVIGDKALFDLGLSDVRRVHGYDLAELGSRAYSMAGETLERLAEDPRLRKFFSQNRLLTLPLREEVVFLRQCAERIGLYAEILKETYRVALDQVAREESSGAPFLVTEPADDAELVTEEASDEDDYVRAARGSEESAVSSKERLLSSYERVLLFSSLDLPRLQGALESTVIDQEEAIGELCDEFSLFAAGTRDPRKPPAYFLVGPTGVGKNHLVESLARLLEGLWEIEVPLLTIEGPNYTYPSDINELRGATRGFIRSDEEGILTSFHQKTARAPLGVILIDEVEKAHPQLRTFFLSILDRGTTTDNRGEVLDFSNCLIFFTSNLGYSDAQQRASPIGYMEEESRLAATDHDIRKDLRRALSPEFMNRVKMLHFNRLTRSSAERILSLEFQKIASRYREIHDVTLALDESARTELIRRGFSAQFGARPLAATLESLCNVEIARKLRDDDKRPAGERGELIQWLREMRAGERAFDESEVRERVVASARAELDYRTLRIAYRDGRFSYDELAGEVDPS